MHKIENPYCYIVTKLQCDVWVSPGSLTFHAIIWLFLRKVVPLHPEGFKNEQRRPCYIVRTLDRWIQRR